MDRGGLEKEVTFKSTDRVTVSKKGNPKGVPSCDISDDKYVITPWITYKSPRAELESFDLLVNDELGTLEAKAMNGRGGEEPWKNLGKHEGD